MRSIFFYTIGIGFAFGIFLQTIFSFGVSEILLVTLLSIACLVIWRRKAVSVSSPLFISSLLLFCAMLGMARFEWNDSRQMLMSHYTQSEVSFEGLIVREPEVRTNTVHMHVRPYVGGTLADEKVLVTVDRYIYAGTFQYGDTVTVQGELVLPETFATDGGRAFDYQGYLRAQGVGTIIYDAEVLTHHIGDTSLLRTLFSWKQQFMIALEKVLPAPHSGLGEGILLGVKRALGNELEEAFRKTGIIHIVVLSGYNILIVVEAMMILLAYVCRPKMRMIFGLLWILSFAFLVGLSATVVRASLMASLLLVARGTGRNYAVLRALMLAGIVMLIINPYLLVYDIGFQLSFLATLGLILFTPYIEERLTIVPSVAGFRGIATATIATQIIVLPLLLYHTGMLSVVSLAVNILVLPMVPIAMLLTFLAGVAGVVSQSFGTIIGFFAYGALDYIIAIAESFASLPLSAHIVEAFPFWIAGIAYFVMSVGYVFLEKTDTGTKVQEKACSIDLDGWTIEEEKSSGTESVPEDVDTLPFR